MNQSLQKTIIKTVGLGNLAGIRSMAAPAIVFDHFNRNNNVNLSNSPFSFTQSSKAVLTTAILTALETAGDKLPGTPDRTIAPQVAGRVISGALVGAVLFQADKQDWVKGAVLGGVSALAATYVSFFARKFFGDMFSIKEPYAGVAEDAIAIGSGYALMKL